MPSRSVKQKKLMCIAESMKKVKTPKNYSPAAARISEQMNEEQLKEFCENPIETNKENGE
jgi:hypothetical protein